MTFQCVIYCLKECKQKQQNGTAANAFVAFCYKNDSTD